MWFQFYTFMSIFPSKGKKRFHQATVSYLQLNAAAAMAALGVCILGGRSGEAESNLRKSCS